MHTSNGIKSISFKDKHCGHKNYPFTFSLPLYCCCFFGIKGNHEKMSQQWFQGRIHSGQFTTTYFLLYNCNSSKRIMAYYMYAFNLSQIYHILIMFHIFYKLMLLLYPTVYLYPQPSCLIRLHIFC